MDWILSQQLSSVGNSLVQQTINFVNTPLMFPRFSANVITVLLFLSILAARPKLSMTLPMTQALKVGLDDPLPRKYLT